MARKGVGIHGKVSIFLGKLLCIDPITQYGGDPNKWELCSRAFTLRMTFLTIFFAAFHCKVRIYDVLVSPRLSFQSYVLMGCSTSAIFFSMSQMYITFFTAHVYMKMIKNIRDIYIQENYSVNLRYFSTITQPENYTVAIIIVQSFVSASVTSLYWYQVVSKGILDMYVEVTLAMSTFLYFNITYLLKKSFDSLHERSKEITDGIYLKKLWMDYLKLHGIVEKACN